MLGQVAEVTLEGHLSVREVHLQDGGFGPPEEAGVQVIMMGHTRPSLSLSLNSDCATLLHEHNIDCTEPNHGPIVVGCIRG